MAIHDQFEPVRASLIRHHPLLTFDDDVMELHFKKTRLGAKPQNSNTMLAVNYSKSKKKINLKECRYCHETTYTFLTIPNGLTSTVIKEVQITIPLIATRIILNQPKQSMSLLLPLNNHPIKVHMSRIMVLKNF